MDAGEVHLHARLAKVWQKRGQPLRVPAAGADRKFAVFGARDYATGQVRAQLRLRKNRQAFVGVVEPLRQAWPQAKRIVVVDHVGDHTSHRTSAWRRRWHSRLGPFLLPAYTPELNLMARVWRHVKATLSGHRWWADGHALWAAPEALLGHLRARLHQTNGPGLDRVQNFCATT